MKTDEMQSLAKLYATWPTDDLSDVVHNRRSAYAPEAIAIMCAELGRRGVAMDVPETAALASASAPLPLDVPFALSTVTALPVVLFLSSFGMMWALSPLFPSTEELAQYFFLIVIYGMLLTVTWLPAPYLLVAFAVHGFALKRIRRTRTKVVAVSLYFALTVGYMCYWIWWHASGQQLTLP